MHTRDVSPWQHLHIFDSGSPQAEKRTWRVVVLTSAMMVVEIVAGWMFHSMAVLADGWHMSTHAGALGITALAYVIARRLQSDARFAFGTWKIEVLGGFASAVLLAVVAVYMAVVSVQRLARPLDIRYDQALAVACIGLAVNLASALMLGGRSAAGGHHGHGHGPDEHGPAGHADGHSGHVEDGHADLNLRAAYLHVLADATTSALAIAALLGGKFFGWAWLDPVMGIVGAGLVSFWAWGLLRDTSRVLLDREMDHEIVQNIRDALEADLDTRVSDLHVWRVGSARFACLVSVVATHPKTPDEYKALIRIHGEIAHATVEVHACSPQGPTRA